MPLAVVQSLSGIGDGLLGLTAVCGLAERFPEETVVYVCHPNARPWVELFEGRFDLADQAPQGARRYDLAPTLARETAVRGGGRTRAQWYGLACDGTAPRHPRPRRLPRSPYPGCVALCPLTAGWTRREWLLPNWLALEKALSDAGFAVVVLGHDPAQLAPFASPKLTGEPATVAALLAECRLAIGCDTGLMHLCGALSAPGLVLSGPTLGGLVYGDWPSIRALEGALPCRGCYGEILGPACQTTCAAINQIPLDAVLELACEAPEPRPREGETLSLGQGQSIDPTSGEILPWYTPAALAEIQAWELASKVVLEWGGGASTLWWARRAREVFTIEANPAWADWLRRRAGEAPNLTVEHRPMDLGADAFTRLPQGCWPDIVVIDGPRRVDCLRAALRFPRPLTVIADNWRHAGAVNPEAERLMRPYLGRSYPKLGASDGRPPWQTAIWELPNEVFESL